MSRSGIEAVTSRSMERTPYLLSYRGRSEQDRVRQVKRLGLKECGSFRFAKSVPCQCSGKPIHFIISHDTQIATMNQDHKRVFSHFYFISKEISVSKHYSEVSVLGLH